VQLIGSTVYIRTVPNGPPQLRRHPQLPGVYN
jgi:hypothetical protein